MVRIHEIKLGTKEDISKLKTKAEKRLRLPHGSVKDVIIVKESLDAREKPLIYRVFSLDIISELPDEAILSEARRAHVKAAISDDKDMDFPVFRKYSGKRPVVCGFGPCGIFAGLTLAKAGLKPIIIERGARMDRRIEAVEAFWSGGDLDPNANVQFGEGGAGSFSDGKLTTGTKDPVHKLILKSLVNAGADPDILYKQHPHVGTDVLRTVVVNLRKEIKALGGEVRFETKLEALEIADGKLKSVKLSSGDTIETDALIIALGHSARDSFEMLYKSGLMMEQKQFSMGVRIEHKQSLIDMAQLAAPHEELGTGAAEYKLNCRAGDGRGVYTFCMCPGGYVVASASEPGQLCTNGMSNRARDAENANSAVLVDVLPSDFGSEHPLAGAALQTKYEKLAFEIGGANYFAPAQRVGDFLGLKTAIKDEDLVNPSYAPGVKWTEISECLPGFVSKAIKEALPQLDRKLRGFSNPGAVMTAIESRSSSPVRIKRDAQRRALASDGSVIEGLYPGGEGAGYAGGIMSAAADGYHLAQAVISRLCPDISQG